MRALLPLLFFGCAADHAESPRVCGPARPAAPPVEVEPGPVEPPVALSEVPRLDHLGLQPDAEIVFFGDSITQDGHHIAALQGWFAAAMPFVPLRFTNAGVGGNTVISALERLDAEVLARDPALVFVQFGMNDGGYRALDVAALERYRDGLRITVERVRAFTGATVVLMTPPMYDRAARSEGDDSVFDYDATVRAFADATGEVAAELDALFVDVHAAMRAVVEQGHPLSPDGIHPSATGGFVIARAVLEALLAGGPAQEVELDCGPGRAEAFTLERLPYWYPGDGRGLPGGDAFAARFDRMRVRCSLPEGVWRARIGDREIARAAAAEWSAGLDLTAMDAAPWTRRARDLAAALEARRVLVEEKLRVPVQDLKKEPGDRCDLYAEMVPALEADLADELAALDRAVAEAQAPLEVEWVVEAAE